MGDIPQRSRPQTILCFLLGVAACIAIMALKQIADHSRVESTRNANTLSTLSDSQRKLDQELVSRMQAMQAEQLAMQASLKTATNGLRELAESVEELQTTQEQLVDKVTRVAKLIPQAVEPGWQLHETITFARCSSARYHPKDGRIYVGRRASSGRVFRIDAEGHTKVAEGNNIGGLAINYEDGAIFYSEDVRGYIYRIGFEAPERQRWATGFHGGDDDPFSMAIVTSNFANEVVAAGDVLVTDRGHNGPNELWKFRVNVPEGEKPVVRGGMRHPLDVCVGPTGAFLIESESIDLAGSPLPGEVRSPSGVYEVLPGGKLQQVPMDRPLFALHAMAAADDGSLLLLDAEAGEVVRLNPETGAVRSVIQDIGRGRLWAGLDLSPDSKHRIVTQSDRDSIYHFVRHAS